MNGPSAESLLDEAKETVLQAHAILTIMEEGGLNADYVEGGKIDSVVTAYSLSGVNQLLEKVMGLHDRIAFCSGIVKLAT